MSRLLALRTAVGNATDVVTYICRESRVRDWVALAIIALLELSAVWNLLTGDVVLGVTQFLLATAVLAIVVLTWLVELLLDSVEANLPSGDPE